MEIMSVFIFIFVVGLIVTLAKDFRTSKGSSSSDMDTTDILNQQQQMQIIEEMNRQQQEQFTNWSMEQGQASETPFEHGGNDTNVQTDSFGDNNSLSNDI